MVRIAIEYKIQENGIGPCTVRLSLILCDLPAEFPCEKKFQLFMPVHIHEFHHPNTVIESSTILQASVKCKGSLFKSAIICPSSRSMLQRKKNPFCLERKRLLTHSMSIGGRG